MLCVEGEVAAVEDEDDDEDAAVDGGPCDVSSSGGFLSSSSSSLRAGCGADGRHDVRRVRRAGVAAAGCGGGPGGVLGAVVGAGGGGPLELELELELELAAYGLVGDDVMTYGFDWEPCPSASSSGPSQTPTSKPGWILWGQPMR